MTIRIIDRGWENIKEQLRLAEGSYTKVGFPLGAIMGKATKKKLVKIAGKEKYGSISDIAKVAVWQEFGTEDEFGVERIPARPFMSTSFDESVPELNSRINNLYNKIIEGKLHTQRGLAILGEFMTTQIKKKIQSIMFPPNAPSTIRAKRSSKPLIDSAQMINTVTHVEVMR